MIEEPARRGALLALVLTKQERQAGAAKAGRTPGCTDPGMVQFRMPRGGSRVKSRLRRLAFRRASSGLFGDLLGRIPRARA